MAEVVIVEAGRSPIGKRNGPLAGAHPADVLGPVMMEVLKRAGVSSAQVGQVVGGCINNRTQYVEDGSGWVRTFVPNNEEQVSIVSFAPETGSYRIERHLLRRTTHHDRKHRLGANLANAGFVLDEVEEF